MDIYKYIIEQINQFLLSFTGARVRYGYDELARVHTLEIHPSNLFDSDSFQKWEGTLIEDFIRINPTENLCICPKDDILGVGELLYEKEGIGYGYISQSKNPRPILSVFTTFLTEGTAPISSFTLDENVSMKPCLPRKVDNDYSLAA